MCLPHFTALIKLKYMHHKKRLMIRWIISCGASWWEKKCKSEEMCLPHFTALIKLKYVHHKKRLMIRWIISCGASWWGKKMQK